MIKLTKWGIKYW